MKIPDFEGKIIRRGDHEYDSYRYQYATTSRTEASDMSPSFLLYPDGHEDISKAIRFASENELSIAVRTGGHQYSGASSTSGDNFQIDLGQAFQEFQYEPETGLVRVGVSRSLISLNKELGDEGMFVPHGVCGHVHVGGHACTGGYGQLTRPFGLMSDHVEGIEIITADGEFRKISRFSRNQEEKDIFFAAIGGSPGNIGIITHLIMRPLHDSDHPNSRGMKLVFFYSRKRLKRLLDLFVEMSDDIDMPAELSYAVTVMSESVSSQAGYWDSPDKEAMEKFPQFFGESSLPLWPSIIVIYAQYSDLSGDGKTYDPSWFQKIKDAANGRFPDFHLTQIDHDDEESDHSLSNLSKLWVFNNVREFDLPFVKSAYATDSRTLKKDGWAEDVIEQLDDVMGMGDGIDVCCQFFHWGGDNSKLTIKEDDRTAFNWRKGNLCCIMDLFYGQKSFFVESPEKKAKAWQKETKDLLIGPDGSFSEDEKLYLWGSHGSRDMSIVWPKYYDSEAKWNRLCEIKKRFDPHGVFTPNKFCTVQNNEEKK